MHDALCVVRGGGDLATGVAWRLTRAGYPVVVPELACPLTVRRLVALRTAVLEGSVDIEGMTGRLVASPDEAVVTAGAGEVAVMVSPDLPDVDAAVVVDARLAKRNLDTCLDDAPLVVGLGPGFTVGEDAHAVVETARGPRLGRCLWHGSAEPDTGTPGVVGGRGAERVLRSSGTGSASWRASIGDIVEEGELLGAVGASPVVAPFPGRVRGLIGEQVDVLVGLKVGDLDPRLDVAVDEISDKALAVGGGVLEAVTTWHQRSR